MLSRISDSGNGVLLANLPSIFKVLLLVSLLAAVGCSSTPRNHADVGDPDASEAGLVGESAADEFEADDFNDPLESVNRRIFAFNNFLDRWLLRPSAKAYQWLTPGFVDQGISNFFDNLEDVPSLLNAGLQGDFKQMAHSTARVLLNSTAGMGGFVDVASDMGVERRVEDFGQTLGHWGVPAGPYVELPFMGGRNLRDAFALIPDQFMQPVTYVDDQATRAGLVAVNLVDVRADLLALEAFIAGDRYSFIRDVYRQRREADVRNGQSGGQGDGSADDDFDDDFADDDF